MRKKLLYMAGGLLAICMLISVGFIEAASEQETVEQPADFTNLKFYISTVKDDFVPLEPIPLLLRLSNETSRPVIGHTALEFSSGATELFVSRDESEMQNIENLATARVDGIFAPIVFKPGEYRQVKQLITVPLEKYFLAPGKYKLKAVLHEIGGKKLIESNTIKIRIGDPQGKDVPALEHIRNSKNSSFFLSGIGLWDEKNLLELEQFADTFGDSSYGDYADYVLGEIFLHKKNLAKANKHFLKLESKLKFIYREEVLNNLKKIKDKQPH